MAQQYKHFSEGDFGELHGYTEKDAPAGTIALVEEDGTTLTPAGIKFCQKRGLSTPTVEAIRVLHAQYHSPALSHAVEAQALSATFVREQQEKTKRVSEELRLDWAAQDKAYKQQVAAKKDTP
ncbi:MAG: hypothetical protein GKS05_00310 [Nitrospirales bacterium]|nr:hypothetical protein [Nitrospirales bacterium]NKB80342.1 hypothetical protein [Nitrospirales bacterium]